MTGFEVDPAELRQAATRIRSCVAPAAEVDIVGAAGASGDHGHRSLYDALGRFCTTWQFAVAMLREHAHEAGGELASTADRYVQSDAGGAQDLERAFGSLRR